jgi:enoyl-CoA hydratase/carnithine racemase
VTRQKDSEMPVMPAAQHSRVTQRSRVTQGTGDVAATIEGAVAQVLIDRPAARNALSPEVIAGIGAAIDSAAAAGCSVLVIRGAGGTLSAGADLKHLNAIRHDPAALRGYIGSIGAMVQRIADAPFVSVAVVEEYALAGGFEILLACDLAVVSEQARLGDRHLRYGLLPGAGGSVRLARAAPAAVARRLLYTGEMIDGASAARAGLVSHAVPAGQLDAELAALVARLAGQSRTALRRMKELYRMATTSRPDVALANERETLLRHLGADPGVAEGLAAFAEHRTPDFSQFPGEPS